MASLADDSPAVDEFEVRALYQSMLTSWNRRNAEKIAALYAPAGNLVGFDGSQMNGSAEIAATLKQIFADHLTATYVDKIREVRLLTPDVALVRAVMGMVPPGQTDLNPAVNAIQSMVAVKYLDQWRIALFHNTPAQFHGRPDLAEQLTQELRELVKAARDAET